MACAADGERNSTTYARGNLTLREAARSQMDQRGRPQLNPRFCEWLMGWPIGWSDANRPLDQTAFASWETGVVPACAALAFLALEERAGLTAK